MVFDFYKIAAITSVMVNTMAKTAKPKKKSSVLTAMPATNAIANAEATFVFVIFRIFFLPYSYHEIHSISVYIAFAS